jgi:hypothetical protein
LNDDERPRLIERARGGDWDAIEDLVVGALAPTFDAALHLSEGAADAAVATEDALFAMLVAIRDGALPSGDPLAAAAAALAGAAGAAGKAPFAAGLSPEDLVAIARRPDDPRRGDLGKVPAADRIAAVLAFSLDLDAGTLAEALGARAADVQAAIDRVLGAIPHDRPAEALRDVLDARAARVRLPLDVEERVLDRFEKA